MLCLRRLLLLLASVATAVLLPRDYTAINQNLTKLYVSVDNLTSTIQNANGTLITYVPLLNYQQYLLGNFSSTTNSITATPSLTSAQAVTILGNIRGILYPKLQTALNAFVGKKANFTKFGLGSYEASYLVTLNITANSFATAAVSKAPAAQKSSASVLSSSIRGLILSAQQAYSAAPTS